MISNAQAQTARNAGDCDDAAKPSYVMIFVPGPVEYGDGIDENMEQASDIGDRIPEEPVEQTGIETRPLPAGGDNTPWYMHRLVWAFGGLCLGGMVLLGPRPGSSQLPTTPPTNPPVQSSASVPTVTKKPEAKPEETKATDETKPDAGKPVATNSASPSGADTSPANPFAGTITGTLPGPDTPILPDIRPGSSLGTSQPPVAPAKATLLTISRARTSSAKADIVAVAKGLGGSSHSFAEADPHGGTRIEGVILFVPASKLDEALAKVGGSVDGRWSGPATDREDQLIQPYKDRIDALEAKKSELLVKYLEDAPEVREIQDAIDSLTKTMAQLHPDKSKDSQAWIVVTLE